MCEIPWQKSNRGDAGHDHEPVDEVLLWSGVDQTTLLPRLGSFSFVSSRFQDQDSRDRKKSSENLLNGYPFRAVDVFLELNGLFTACHA